MSIRLSLKGT